MQRSGNVLFCPQRPSSRETTDSFQQHKLNANLFEQTVSKPPTIRALRQRCRSRRKNIRTKVAKHMTAVSRTWRSSLKLNRMLPLHHRESTVGANPSCSDQCSEHFGACLVPVLPANHSGSTAAKTLSPHEQAHVTRFTNHRSAHLLRFGSFSCPTCKPSRTTPN